MTTQHDDQPGSAADPTSSRGRAPLLLTATLAEPVQALFQTLRNQHFPADRNVVPVHVSLFHHLPGEARAPIVRRLQALALGDLPERPVVRVEAPFPLGRGVAFRLQAPVLQRIRAELARDWAAWLTPQDAQGWRPHVTVQNKVEPPTARALLDQLARGFVPFETEAASLQLWRYLDGPWELLDTFALKQRVPG
ncbi:2'-5' RNA ligase family protein [Lichenicola sp.]|uniref:2'-5' RNA ligase family protein n=1 Tax=Lichenicola sp. TaxID=2804529 RepID=UPI003B00F202